ncbi:OmpA family protein [Bacteroides luti]|jgi:OmpA family.|uniref:OmpA family protein n=1 Tax=Bacteroides luti TaxID=1297750 RepID=A0A1M4XJK1_9BACE|nr:DUF3868 domain-containing protein [Bacteroides luti]SHE93352.1 OmpA family protein [Bacteroides luti]
MNLKIYISAFVLLLTLQNTKINAQQAVSSESVRVLSTDVRKYETDLIIEMILDISDLKLASNRTMTIIPILETQNQSKALPEVLINGKRKHIVYTRNLLSNNPGNNLYTEVRRINKTKQQIKYRTSVPIETWMRESILALNINLCGCGGKQEKDSQLVLVNIADIKVKDVKGSNELPDVAYITPQAEEIKTRKEEGKAYLDFPENKTIINFDYRHNPIELEKIRQTIDKIKNDKNTHITDMTIHGYASPEGNYTENSRLANERAKALQQYINNLYNLGNIKFTVKSTPEDWDGLSSYIKKSNLKNKNQILAIINENISPDAKEQKLKNLNAGESYQFMLHEYFPALRHSDYTVSYIVKGFSIEETKEIIKKYPQQLSLQEMYLLAQTYEKGSNEFNEVFDIAVRMFPDDPIANLNASSIALIKRDIAAAKKYLAKANKQSPETINNLGVLAVLEEQKGKAEKLFEKASTAGVPQALSNLKELEKDN